MAIQAKQASRKGTGRAGSARRATRRAPAAARARKSPNDAKPGKAKPSWSVPPETPARIAAAGVLEALRRAMLAEQPGVEAGTDPECLHRYRVALRRTRTLLAQLRRELPSRRVSALRNELAWLGEVTTHVRDMDVYLAHWPAYRREVPAARRKHLVPLHGHWVTRRERLQNVLLRALRSDRYSTLMQTWAELEARLREPPGKHSKSIGKVAGKRLERLRKRLIAEAAKLNEAAPPLQLHELRKTCKKLRYMLEFSRGLLPKKELRQLLSHLKELQDALGAMHDLYVHHAALAEFSQALSGKAPAETQQAMALLLDHLQAKRRGAFVPVEKQLREFSSLLARPQTAAMLSGKAPSAGITPAV